MVIDVGEGEIVIVAQPASYTSSFDQLVKEDFAVERFPVLKGGFLVMHRTQTTMEAHSHPSLEGLCHYTHCSHLEVASTSLASSSYRFRDLRKHIAIHPWMDCKQRFRKSVYPNVE